jgi:hypothetical protein
MKLTIYTTSHHANIVVEDEYTKLVALRNRILDCTEAYTMISESTKEETTIMRAHIISIYIEGKPE